MINTYSESRLHKTLKNLYAMDCNGKTEQPVEGKICDILAHDGSIIEIQTGSLAKLHGKLGVLLPSHRVTVVYPLVVKKTIETVGKDGSLVSRRKSPKKQGVLDIFRELTSIYSYLLHEHFTLEVLEVSVVEHRIKVAKPMQLANKSRRFKRDWYKEDKSLAEIHATHRFSSAQDYLALLPPSLPESFTVKEAAAILRTGHAGMMLWVLRKMGLVEAVGKQGKALILRRREEGQISEAVTGDGVRHEAHKNAEEWREARMGTPRKSVF